MTFYERIQIPRISGVLAHAQTVCTRAGIEASLEMNLQITLHTGEHDC